MRKRNHKQGIAYLKGKIEAMIDELYPVIKQECTNCDCNICNERTKNERTN